MVKKKQKKTSQSIQIKLSKETAKQVYLSDSTLIFILSHLYPFSILPECYSTFLSSSQLLACFRPLTTAALQIGAQAAQSSLKALTASQLGAFSQTDTQTCRHISRTVARIHGDACR